MSFFRRVVGIKWGILLAGVGIAFYTIPVEAEVAVVRAAIMGGIAFLLIKLNSWIYLEINGKRISVVVEWDTP